jgi:hypothetical protein
MVEISKLSRIIDGANRSISLATNTIVVDNIKIRLATSNAVSFAGILTADRTITTPDADVDLGNIANLITLSGVPAGDLHLGIFSGSIINDNVSIKQAIQELETFTENNVTTQFADNAFRILDDSDPTKKIAFEAAAIAPTETRTIIMPDNDVDLGEIQTDITNLKNVTPFKEKHPISALPTNLVYIDLLHEAIPLTIQVSIDRLLLHEDDDYIISVEELNPGEFTTRLTWTGDIIVGGTQALDLTDTIRVKYYYQA